MNKHQVQAGETLDIIAGRYTGDPSRAYELAYVNPQMHVRQVGIGAPIQFQQMYAGQYLNLPQGWGQTAQGGYPYRRVRTGAADGNLLGPGDASSGTNWGMIAAVSGIAIGLVYLFTTPTSKKKTTPYQPPPPEPEVDLTPAVIPAILKKSVASALPWLEANQNKQPVGADFFNSKEEVIRYVNFLMKNGATNVFVANTWHRPQEFKYEGGPTAQTMIAKVPVSRRAEFEQAVRSDSRHFPDEFHPHSGGFRLYWG